PLFQVLFEYFEAPAGELELPGLEVEWLEFENETSKLDLTLSVQDGDRIRGAFQYAADLFDPASIEALRDRYERLLESVVAAPEARASELALLGEAERRRLLVEWNDTAAEFPRELCLHELFERQAQAEPQARALVAGAEQLTYAQLNARANRLAHHLRAAGVGQETLVGLCLRNGVELLVCLLAILKAGGAYVPLD